MQSRREFLVRTVAAGALVAQSMQPVDAPARSSGTSSATTLKIYKIPNSDLAVSRIAYGCADLVAWDKQPLDDEAVAKAASVIRTAHEQGITFFDIADIYGFWKAESAFGAVLKQSPRFRDELVIQSKCGSSQHDAPLCADSSYQHIKSSVEGSLRRLGTDHLDILLLHQPDALIEPAEVAKAFDELKQSGKVRYFGVSNYSAPQLELLQRTINQPLIVNQVPLGLGLPDLILDGFSGTSGTLDYCRMNNIQVQAYSPLRGNLLNPPANASTAVKDTAQLLTNLAKQKVTNPAAIMLAWLLRHPAGIVPILGATNPKHIIEDCAADKVILSREEWYSLFSAVMNERLPA